MQDENKDLKSSGFCESAENLKPVERKIAEKLAMDSAHIPAIAGIIKNELVKDAQMPGAWRCPKCNFTLQKSVLHVADGGISANTEPFNNVCPNDGTLMKPLTWREANKEFHTQHIADVEKIRAMEKEIAWRKEHMAESDKELCQIEDWLGANGDVVQASSEVAAKCRERIRDLIAKEGELGDAKEKIAQLQKENELLQVQRDQVLHLLQGGENLTDKDVIKSGLGVGVLSEKRHHEFMRCKAEKERDSLKALAQELVDAAHYAQPYVLHAYNDCVTGICKCDQPIAKSLIKQAVEHAKQLGIEPKTAHL